MIGKPLSVIRKETANAIIKIIDDSQLPAFVVAPLLQDLFNQSVVAMNKEYERDLMQYQMALKENNDK